MSPESVDGLGESNTPGASGSVCEVTGTLPDGEDAVGDNCVSSESVDGLGESNSPGASDSAAATPVDGTDWSIPFCLWVMGLLISKALGLRALRLLSTGFCLGVEASAAFGTVRGRATTGIPRVTVLSAGSGVASLFSLFPLADFLLSLWLSAVS